VSEAARAAAQPQRNSAATDVDASKSRAVRALRWYSAVPVAMLLDSSISAEAVRLAAILLHYDGKDGLCYPKISTLEKDLNVSKNTVLRLLIELEQYQFLTRKKQGKKNFYSLTPLYVEPVRPDAFAVTGDLEVQNAPRARPRPRKQLRRERPEPMLPLEAPRPVSPVAPIDRARARRGAERKPAAEPRPAAADGPDDGAEAAAIETLRGSLIEVGINPEDALAWATGCFDIPVEDVVEAVGIMRLKPAYLRRQITNGVGYIRTLVNTQVHTNRLLREHEARKSESTRSARPVRPAFEAEPIALAPEERLATPTPADVAVAVIEAPTAEVPDWWRPICEAMVSRLSPEAYAMFFQPIRATTIDGEPTVVVPVTFTLNVLRKKLGRDLDVELASLGFIGRLLVADHE
jgi:hypothetical protein